MESELFKLSEKTIGWCRKHKREDAALFVYIFIEHDESVPVEDPATQWPAVVGLRFAAEGAIWSDQITRFVVTHEQKGGEDLSLEEEIARDVIVMYEKNRHHAEETAHLLNKLGIAAIRTP